MADTLTHDPATKSQIAEIVCHKYVDSDVATRKRDLIKQFRNIIILTEMERTGLLAPGDNQDEYLPSFGSFALLPENDPLLAKAKEGMLRVLAALQRMYEREDAPTSHTFEDLLTEARELNHHEPFALDNLRIGLQLASNFGAFTSYARPAKHGAPISSFTISDHVMTIGDPQTLWSERVKAAKASAVNPNSGIGLPIPLSAADRPQASATVTTPERRRASWLPDGWEIERSLTEGGQGWTYLATRVHESGTQFVIKRLKNRDRADRFRAEIDALKRLSHPHILKIIEHGEAEDRPFYVAEYCAGGELNKETMANQSTLRKLLFFSDICHAVAAAHEMKIVHRDIKPSNILLRGNGEAVVGDFGLCIDLANLDDRATATSEAVGARYFMAPELEDGRTEDPKPAADVYSLGKLLYFMLAGRVFSREKHREGAFNLLESAGQPSDPHLQFVYEVFDKSIVPEHQRYKDASELCQAVDGVIKRIEQGANILNLALPQRCRYCGVGEYREMQGGSRDQNRLTLVCRNCGNVQQFSPPYNGAKIWWMTR